MNHIWGCHPLAISRRNLLPDARENALSAAKVAGLPMGGVRPARYRGGLRCLVTKSVIYIAIIILIIKYL